MSRYTIYVYIYSRPSNQKESIPTIYLLILPLLPGLLVFIFIFIVIKYHLSIPNLKVLKKKNRKRASKNVFYFIVTNSSALVG